MILTLARCCLLLASLSLLSGCDRGTPNTLTLGITTTVEDSGLMTHLSSRLEQQGFTYQTIVGASGKILRLANDGEVDVIITHHPKGEQALVNSGLVKNQQPLMYNQFLLVGPQSDPAHVATSIELTEAFKKIAQKKAAFISRADDSGTAQFEQLTWQAANINDYANGVNTGAGMADTLRVAVERKAYTVVDNATWLALSKETSVLRILFEDEHSMRNVYQLSLLKAKDSTSAAKAKELTDWLLSEQGTGAINSFRINGQQVFYPAP